MSSLHKNIEQLRRHILKAKHAYYYSGEPIMSDAEYDALDDQLRQVLPGNLVFTLAVSLIGVVLV
jgi:NAD-dependent DNA ligase